MDISKDDAIRLIDKYISQFEQAKAFPAPLPNPYYEGAIQGSLNLLTELFGEKEANQFSQAIRPLGSIAAILYGSVLYEQSI